MGFLEESLDGVARRSRSCKPRKEPRSLYSSHSEARGWARRGSLGDNKFAED